MEGGELTRKQRKRIFFCPRRSERTKFNKEDGRIKTIEESSVSTAEVRVHQKGMGDWGGAEVAFALLIYKKKKKTPCMHGMEFRPQREIGLSAALLDNSRDQVRMNRDFSRPCAQLRSHFIVAHAHGRHFTR